MIIPTFFAFLLFVVWVESYALREKYSLWKKKMMKSFGTADAVFKLPPSPQYWMHSNKINK